VQITDEDIRRFQAIWREEFAEELNADEARSHIARLDALYLLLARRSRPQEAAPPGSEDTQHP
jgi:hypothetical protein